ncbi:Serine/threonine-protein phosphatase 2A activator [Cyanidiococcus yangmingshanensis]|uniref:Serine/threonine-protein phosphatase 2A activator n=1 Tax=Cyanidiococcus yangmingshanensis TaxID=2690220 RepID=A0A7J7IPI3_9RHOD|nr:Serine/threonine-protein phosphatase 2A activator [Cyanidiococcus yangmingshanensis]
MESFRRVCNRTELEAFLASDTFRDIWKFVETLNRSVQGRPRPASATPQSPVSAKIIAMMEAFGRWATEIEPLPAETGRFGNRAFRSWYARLQQQAPALVLDLVFASETPEHYAPDLQAYLMGAFGDSTRIDYGTGHEASFLLFLLGLYRLGLFGEDAFPELVLLVFPSYLTVTRCLQQRYMLEPAGSHGVWGLDDYAFLPFLWGSSQLCGKEAEISPLAVRSRELVEQHAPQYLYFEAIRFILETKKGPFYEHSPTLYDISNLESWTRINAGLLRMYRAEVWSKLPVVQHIPFGELIPFRGGTSTPAGKP